eukprot:TRINITY_DN37_c0_g2_i13.p2 TRINITY_DN37_c0_g2~~TRINITY_DN37_c0_g2_i13.p2  ORF type:complete len:104 (-),score=6.24 TRINITY_DN37_c0_g2_i13:268-579(-)
MNDDHAVVIAYYVPSRVDGVLHCQHGSYNMRNDVHGSNQDGQHVVDTKFMHGYYYHLYFQETELYYDSVGNRQRVFKWIGISALRQHAMAIEYTLYDLHACVD